MTKVKAIKCLSCGDTIFSRARHDFRSCSCGKVSIDGGFDYTKLSFPAGMKPPEIFDLEVKQTPMELYDDWNTGKDRFGLFRGNKCLTK
jgi:hypothetical protein